jgi:hypothetical protein
MAHLSFQLYLDTKTATYLESATLRNKMGMMLNEPIVVPDGYFLTVSLVDAEIPVNWTLPPLTPAYKYILVGSNLSARNQFVKGRYIAKIPKDVGSNYRLVYNSYASYKHPVKDTKVDYIEVGIYAEDGSDLNLSGPALVGTGYDWSCTLQFDFHRNDK